MSSHTISHTYHDDPSRPLSASLALRKSSRQGYAPLGVIVFGLFKLGHRCLQCPNRHAERSHHYQALAHKDFLRHCAQSTAAATGQVTRHVRPRPSQSKSDGTLGAPSSAVWCTPKSQYASHTVASPRGRQQIDAYQVILLEAELIHIQYPPTFVSTMQHSPTLERR